MSRATVLASGAREIYAIVRARRGTRAAVAVCLGSFWALSLAAVRARGRPRLQNALRHFAWAAWLTARYGADLALEVGEKHERRSRQPLDSIADRRNNDAGRAFAEDEQARRAAAGPAPVALWRLLGAGMSQWHDGRLWMVDHGEVVPSPQPAARR